MAINGFERETKPLSKDELGHVKTLAHALSHRVGKANCITNQEIIIGFKGRGVKVNPSRVRKLINYIRINRIVENVIATNDGYYVETDKREICLYVTSLRQRAEAILEVARSFNSDIKITPKTI